MKMGFFSGYFHKEVDFCGSEDLDRIANMKDVLTALGFVEIGVDFLLPLDMSITEYRRGKDTVSLRVEGMMNASLVASRKVHREIKTYEATHNISLNRTG
jgi:hypothetical protein